MRRVTRQVVSGQDLASGQIPVPARPAGEDDNSYVKRWPAQTQPTRSESQIRGQVAGISDPEADAQYWRPRILVVLPPPTAAQLTRDTPQTGDEREPVRSGVMGRTIIVDKNVRGFRTDQAGPQRRTIYRPPAPRL